MSQLPSDKSSSKASNVSTTASQLKRNSGDVGWEYAVLCNPMNQDKWKCLKCGRCFSGGIYRAKLHISSIPGSVAKCLSASDEDKKKCKEALENVKKKKMEKKQVIERVISDVDVRNGEEMEEEVIEVVGSQKLPRTIGSMDRYVSNINPDDKSRRQQNLNDAISKERTLQVHQYLARWVYESGIPFHAVENVASRDLLRAVGQYGLGYIPPNQYQLREPLLKGEVEKMKASIKVQEEQWDRSGCSIMTDVWSDRKRRSIMNLCVNALGETVFVSSKEASLDAHTGEYIFEYVDECIESIGEEKVVQVLTDNASNNMAAANLLLEKRPPIFWTPCATHSLNLMLQGIGKLPMFMNPIKKANNVTTFMYSHHKTLALMRKCTRRVIDRPGVTRFATAFLTLQSMLEKKEPLRKMFYSTEWDESKWSKSKKGKQASTFISQSHFWSSINTCVKVFTPLVKVLRLVDGDLKPAMGFVYGELQKAKEEIKEALNHKEEKYNPILGILDAKGNGRIDTPLHLTAYMLNPYYYYWISGCGSSWSNVEGAKIMDGILKCMERMFPNLDVQDEVVNVELVKYKMREGKFGLAMAQRGCQTNNARYDPVGWWSNYGHDTPNLQKVAKRILSLTTSSSGCERNWSVFEGIHTKKRNRLDTDRMNKLVYVQFNARLMNKKKKRSDKVDVLLASESSRAQAWMMDGLDGVSDVEEDEDEVTPEELEELQPRRSARLAEQVREPEEDDFVSDGMEDGEDDEEEFDLESDKECDNVVYEDMEY